ncbi:MAG: methyltransferase domain-containing protein [Crenarchaeota archaeon]|nr:methyltransferase domain-containing protein [Thermoproteota archaeon]
MEGGGGRCLSGSLWRSVISHIEAVTWSYTRAARILSLGYAPRIRFEALSRVSPPPGAVFVDVGSGPGDSVDAILVYKPSYIVCIDPSESLLGCCRRRMRRSAALLEPVVAVAEHLPLRDGAADVATSFYAVRDYRQLRPGLLELLRVASRVAVGDIFLPRGRLARLLVRFWVCRVAPALAKLLRLGDGYRGICPTLQGWVSVEELRSTLSLLAGGSAEVESRSFLLGGLGYVVARGCSVDGCEWDTLRPPGRRGVGGEGALGGNTLYAVSREGSRARAWDKTV